MAITYITIYIVFVLMSAYQMKTMLQLERKMFIIKSKNRMTNLNSISHEHTHTQTQTQN